MNRNKEKLINVYLYGSKEVLFKSPEFASKGDTIIFKGIRYKVISREFEIREFTQDWADDRAESPFYITEYFSENYKLIVEKEND